MEMNEILNGLNSCGGNDNIAPQCPPNQGPFCGGGFGGGFGGFSWIWILLILFYSGGFGGGFGIIIIITDAAASKKNAAVRKNVEIAVAQEIQDMVAEASEDAQTGYSY